MPTKNNKDAQRKRLAARRKALDKRKPVVADQQQAAEPKSTNLPEKLIGLKYVRMLEKHLRNMRDEQSRHGNKSLFLDDVFVVYLLAFFNPCIRSLRTLEDLSQVPKVQQHLSIDKVCKSTLSDFNKVIDPDRLKPAFDALRADLSRKNAGKPTADCDLQTLLRQCVAVDGTFLPGVAEVAWAVANKNNHGATRHRARIDAMIAVSTWMPEAIVLPEPGQSEADSAMKHLQAGKIYLYDRGYSGFALLSAHYEQPQVEQPQRAIKSYFVVRYKAAGSNSPTLCDAVEQPLSAEDRAAGIISDRIGYFTSKSARSADVSGCKLREVIIPYEDNGKPKTLRIITNLLDVSAATIAMLYQQRWQVELFFRWFKSFGNFGHLISHSREGALAHLYVTIIGVLLMYLHTGYRPSKYMFAMLSLVASGGATLEDILPILRERERRKELDRQSAARRRAKKKAAGN